MVRTKVFVGNLDFKTKEAELAKAFSAAGKVISANIISRGSRSLGYGFVEMENEEDANKAVQLMNKQELDGRPINVEVAKPREEPPAGQQPQQQQQQEAQQPQQGEQTGSFQRVGGARGGRGRGGFRGGRGRGGSRGRGGARGGRKGFRVRGEQEAVPANTNAPQQAQPAQPAQQQQQKQEDTRTPSKTTLFVANLPFKLDDEGFGKSLKDNTVTFKSAYVVKNQRSGRSKGFGFIEFENEGDQQKALQALDKKVVDGRELVAKVALTEANAAKTEQNAAPAATKQ